MPPKLPVSYPKSISPVSRQKQEKISMGVTVDHRERGLMTASAILLQKGVRRGRRGQD